MSDDAASRLRVAFRETIASLDLADLTARALPETPPVTGRVVVVALGKSAAPMLTGALRRWAPRISRAMVARPERSLALDRSVVQDWIAAGGALSEHATGHPLPDADSVRAGREALEMAQGLTADDLVLVLLSGGASAAACAPRTGVSLTDLREMNRALLRSGLPVEDVNLVRGRIDRLKHGGLSEAAGAAQMLTLVALDVLGTDELAARTVGSAPTMELEIDPVRLETASAVLSLQLRSLTMRSRKRVRGPRGERKLDVIASPASAQRAFEQALTRGGWTVRETSELRSDAASVADHFSRAVPTLGTGEAIVAVGEPTLKLPLNIGRGGRSGWLALRVANAIAGSDAFFLAGATDGFDGEGGHAGAVVNGHTLGKSREMGLDLESALNRFDDAPIHEAVGTTLDVGATGINLLDLYAIVR